MNNTSIILCAVCNEPVHSLWTSRLCRLNPRNQANEDIRYDEQSTDSAVLCSSCHEPGHLRRSYAGCWLNPRFVAGDSINQLTWIIAMDLSAVPSSRDDRGLMNCVCSYCGSLMWIHERVSPTSWHRPEFQLCCCRGKSVLPSLQSTPSEIADYLKSNDIISKEFRKNIRLYNSSLCFTSFGVNLDLNLANNRSGAYTFRIQGSPYHLVGSVAPTEGANPKFAQL